MRAAPIDSTIATYFNDIVQDQYVAFSFLDSKKIEKKSNDVKAPKNKGMAGLCRLTITYASANTTITTLANSKNANVIPFAVLQPCSAAAFNPKRTIQTIKTRSMEKIKNPIKNAMA